MTLRERSQAFDERCPELLAARALWRALAVVGIAQQCGEDGLIRSAGSRETPATVVGLAEDLLGERIDDHVGGAGIEGDQLIECSACRNEGEVSDAAEVLQHARAARMREECRIEQGDERRSLSAGHHVGRTKVRDHRRMSGGGYQGGFTQLPSAGDAAAGVGFRDALVVDGLTVTADEVERVALRGCLHGVAVSLPEAPVEARKLGGGCIPSVLCGKYCSP